MGIFERMGQGFSIGKRSLEVVWNDKSLMLFPVLSGVASIATLAAFYFGIGPQRLESLIGSGERGGSPSPEAYALALGLYFGLFFITIFFNVALIGAASLSLDGKDTTLGDGINEAVRHLGSILAWSLISGTVGLLLSLIENDRRGGRFIRSILGTAWTVITYFVLPVLIFENRNAFEAIGRSGQIMKQSWGEAAGARFSLGGLFFLAVLVAVLIAVGGMAINRQLAIPMLILAGCFLVFSAILFQTAKSVLTVALYRYAAGREAPKGFDRTLLESAFGP